MIERTPHKMVVTLDNVLPADAIALTKMFKYMEYLGKIGSSRQCTFFADGDGSFHPKVTIDYPIELPQVPEITGIVRWNASLGTLENKPPSYEGDFYIDSDTIAWKIYHEDEDPNYIRNPNPQEGAIKKKDYEQK